MEEALEREHNPTKVKEVMFASLEGIAKDNTKMFDENGNLHMATYLDTFSMELRAFCLKVSPLRSLERTEQQVSVIS